MEIKFLGNCRGRRSEDYKGDIAINKHYTKEGELYYYIRFMAKANKIYEIEDGDHIAVGLVDRDDGHLNLTFVNATKGKINVPAYKAKKPKNSNRSAIRIQTEDVVKVLQEFTKGAEKAEYKLYKVEDGFLICDKGLWDEEKAKRNYYYEV